MDGIWFGKEKREVRKKFKKWYDIGYLKKIDRIDIVLYF